MIKTRPKYPTDLNDNIYIDNIQKAVVICLIIPTTFPFDARSSKNKTLDLWMNVPTFYYYNIGQILKLVHKQNDKTIGL
jgi:tRNA(Leu) C34 or U34 (ribose-2'-O)-methylase TrmL